jgi:hypothetical protein
VIVGDWKAGEDGQGFASCEAAVQHRKGLQMLRVKEKTECQSMGCGISRWTLKSLRVIKTVVGGQVL